MKKWQEERNYRRIYNEAGEVIANIITVDGMDVNVAEDVYLAYSQADRRERKKHWNGSRHRALRNEKRCCCWPCCL